LHVWQRKELRVDFVDVWQVKELGWLNMGAENGERRKL